MKFKLTVENNVIEQLHTHKCSILVGIYQTRKFVLFSFNSYEPINQEGLFEEPIAIVILDDQLGAQLIITVNNLIIYFVNHLNLAQKHPNKVFSPCVFYVHRAASLTMEAASPKTTFYKLNLFELNLHYSYLSYFDFNCSFILLCKSTFINYFSDKNYYHLNGMAIIDGETNKALLGKYG